MKRQSKTWKQVKHELEDSNYIVSHPHLVRELSNGNYIYQVVGQIVAKTASEAHDMAERQHGNPYLVFIDGKERY